MDLLYSKGNYAQYFIMEYWFSKFLIFTWKQSVFQQYYQLFSLKCPDYFWENSTNTGV